MRVMIYNFLDAARGEGACALLHPPVETAGRRVEIRGEVDDDIEATEPPDTEQCDKYDERKQNKNQ